MIDGAALERRILDRLEAAGIAHQVVACDPALADTAMFCSHYGFPLERSANTIVVAARKEPDVACACVVLAHTRLDVNHKVCELLGVRQEGWTIMGWVVFAVDGSRFDAPRTKANLKDLGVSGRAGSGPRTRPARRSASSAAASARARGLSRMRAFSFGPLRS